MINENKLILYKDEEGKLSVSTRFADEDVWLTQEQLAGIYQTTQENISMHISNIYADGELEKEGTYKKFLLVLCQAKRHGRARQEGKRQVHRNIDHYNLDMIIALGYRVQSPIAVRFPAWWATSWSPTTWSGRTPSASALPRAAQASAAP